MNAAPLRARVMGCEAEITVSGDARLHDWALRRLQELEAKWSRFRASSEVSRLNAAQGEAVPVSWETSLLVSAAIEAWDLTDGEFDPTVLAAVMAAGYRSSYEPGATWQESDGPPAPGCAEIVVDRAAGTVRLPAGITFDPGGIGKGLAADLVTQELMASGAEGAAANLGGDVRVAGMAPSGSWQVDVEDPFDSDRILVSIGLSEGSVATSSTMIRRWRTQSGFRHHLIDPETGSAPSGEVAAVSVVAGAGWLAEGYAKAAMTAPTPSEAVSRMEHAGIAAVAVGSRGERAFGPRLGAFL